MFRDRLEALLVSGGETGETGWWAVDERESNAALRSGRG